jgi:hypothetical protein
MWHVFRCIAAFSYQIRVLLKKIQLCWLSLYWQAARLSHYVAISAIKILLNVFAFESQERGFSELM